MFSERDGLPQTETEAGLNGQRHGFSPASRDPASARGATRHGSDSGAFAASGNRADDGADARHPGYNSDILTAITLRLCARRLGLNRDMLPIGSVQFGQLQREGRVGSLLHTGEAAFHTRAAFCDDESANG